MPPRRLALALLLVASCLRCSCTPPSDEERLRARVDTLKVHLYLGLKVAAAGDPANDDIADARRLLANANAAVQGGPSPGEPSAVDVFHDTVALTRALLALRRLGVAEFTNYPGASDASLFLRQLLATNATPAADGQTPDPDTLRADEHALITLLLVVGKVHPRTPVPVPVELILYEARVTDAERLALEPLQQTFRAARAYTYGSEDLCDLAAADTAWLAAHPVSVDPNVIMGFGRVVAHAPDSAALLAAMFALPPALQLVAHGSTAACYQGRDDTDAMNVEVQRMVDLAAAWGVPDTELAAVRAYLAYHEGDLEETRRQLALAEQSALLDEQGRGELRTLREGLSSDPGLFASYYNQAFFATWAVRVSVHRLDQAGAFDALWESPPFVRMRAIVEDARVAAERAAEALPDAPDGVGDLTRRFSCAASR